MKILRSVTRRGFSVGTAGWFTVLRPNTWFPSSRYPERHRHIVGQAAALPVPIPGLKASSGADSRGATMPPRIVEIRRENRSLTHMGLIVMAAIAITSVLLWWIIRAK